MYGQLLSRGMYMYRCRRSLGENSNGSECALIVLLRGPVVENVVGSVVSGGWEQHHLTFVKRITEAHC